MRVGQAEPSASPPPTPAGGPPQGTFWIVLLVIAFCLAVMFSRVRRRRPPVEPRPGAFDAGAEDARGELERLLNEIQDLSREQIAKLDTKIRMLNQLLIECDQKKKELEALLGRVVSTGMARLETPARRGEGGPLPARLPNPLHERVYSLQDEGKDLLEICGATGLEKGEVELILGLRKMPPAE